MKRTHLNRFFSLLLAFGLLGADFALAQSDKSGPASDQPGAKPGAQQTQPAKSDPPVQSEDEADGAVATADPASGDGQDQSTNVPTSGPSKPAAKPAAKPAPAAKPVSNPVSEEINEHMPRWLRLNGEYRMRFEGKTGQRGIVDNDDSYTLSRFRLSLTIKPTEQWTFFLQGQDSQVLGYNPRPEPSTLENDFDLRQAYVDWRQSGKQGWAVRVGRQEFKYGEERVIGAADWVNTARAFDAIKVSAFGKHYAVDLFASSVVVPEEGVFDKRRAGQNLYGLHSTFPTLVPKAEVNVYAFWRTTPLVVGERGNRGDSDTVTLGTRLVGKLPVNFDYTAEGMLQRGSFTLDRVRAYAFHGRLGYTITKNYWSPKLLAEYNQASGDENPTDGRRGTYDQLFPTNHNKYGLHDVVGFRNIQNLRFGISFQPNKQWKIDADYHSFWLTKKRDGLYNEAGGLISQDKSGLSGKHVAQEADLQLTYNPKEFISFGAAYAHWFPGEFWKTATKAAPGSSAYIYVSYKF